MNCKNNGEKDRCPNKATTGHIYCNPCRIANGGFDRYNAKCAKAHNHKPGATSANFIA